MNDLVGLSEPIKKLIEVISQGVGNIYKPHLIRKTADARAYEIRQIGSALHDVRKLLGNADYANEEIGLVLTGASVDNDQPLLAERAAAHRQYREQVEQQNIEQITAQAAEELRDVETVSEEAVDPDWIARFFDIARNISNEEMQLIWGKILAGEVKRPNTYSLRTLELMRNLSKNEAETFLKIAKLTIQYAHISFIIFPSGGKYLQEDFDISFAEILLLQELGILYSSDFLKLNIDTTPVESMEGFIYGNKIIFLDRPAKAPSFNFPIRGFTRIGEELLSLVNIEVDIRYIQIFANLLRHNGTAVKLGVITKRNGDEILYDNLRPVETD